MEAVILAAGISSRLKEYTRSTSKCLLKINETTIFEQMISNILEVGIEKIYVVVGHAADQVMQTIKDPRIQYIYNPDYATSNSIISLSLALPLIWGSFFSLPCDLVFERSVLEFFLSRQESIILAVDKSSTFNTDGTKVILNGSQIVKVSKEITEDESHGVITGMQAFYGDAVPLLKKVISELIANGYIHFLNSDVLNWMIQRNIAEVFMADISGLKWCEVDNESDLIRTRRLFEKPEGSFINNPKGVG